MTMRPWGWRVLRIFSNEMLIYFVNQTWAEATLSFEMYMNFLKPCPTLWGGGSPTLCPRFSKVPGLGLCSCLTLRVCILLWLCSHLQTHFAAAPFALFCTEPEGRLSPLSLIPTSTLWKTKQNKNAYKRCLSAQWALLYVWGWWLGLMSPKAKWHWLLDILFLKVL